MITSAFTIRVLLIGAMGLALSGCLATAVVGTVVGVTGAAVGVAGKAVVATAKGAGMVVGAVIPDEEE